MDPTLDPTAIPVAAWDEDPDESFHGPGGLADFFNEEDEEDYYDDDVEGYDEPEPLEISASQRVPQQEVTQAGDVSVHTQFGIHQCRLVRGSQGPLVYYM